MARRERLGVRRAGLLVCGLFVGVVILGLCLDEPKSLARIADAVTQSASDSVGLAAKALPPQVSRRMFYPYSVVPGGVESPEELRKAIEGDKVVADHFEGFDTSRATMVTVSSPRRVHVSYRVNDRVYWTKKKVLLHKGERLVSDGTNLVRARCGNRIEDTPGIVGAGSEPSEAELNSPLSPEPPTLASPEESVVLNAPSAQTAIAEAAPMTGHAVAAGGGQRFPVWPFILSVLAAPAFFLHPADAPAPVQFIPPTTQSASSAIPPDAAPIPVTPSAPQPIDTPPIESVPPSPPAPPTAHISPAPALLPGAPPPFTLSLETPLNPPVPTHGTPDPAMYGFLSGGQFPPPPGPTSGAPPVTLTLTPIETGTPGFSQPVMEDGADPRPMVVKTPEPSSYGELGVALTALFWLVRRKWR